jgi:D-tyrosyl-tRNA(Tyr) deacylase
VARTIGRVRIVLQRVSRASVTVDGEVVGAIGQGVLLLVGVGEGDDDAVAARMAAKVARLRIFPNDDRGFDRTVVDVHGKALVVSQFTLMGDVRRGNRPSWAAAARPEDASPVVDAVARALEAEGVPVATGRFGAMMDVELVNDGPVTLVLDSDDLAAARR